MGFDPLNEPTIAANSILHRAYLMLDGNADKQLLKPMYERIYEVYK
jgi:hypothetical protein